MKGGEQEEMEMEGKAATGQMDAVCSLAQYPQEAHSLPRRAESLSVSPNKMIPIFSPATPPHLCSSSVWSEKEIWILSTQHAGILFS